MSFINFLVTRLTVFLLSLIIIGCGDGGADKFKDYRIEEFFITNSYGDKSEDVIPIDISASTLQGEHVVRWETNAVDPYYIKLGVSDSILGETTTYFDTRCNNQTNTCDKSGEIKCNFSTSNILSCGNIGPDYPLNTGLDLTSFLDQLPKYAYIHLNVCNASIDSCNVAVVDVEFQ